MLPVNLLAALNLADVFKNKKTFGKLKKTLKNVRNVTEIKNEKTSFYIYAVDMYQLFGEVSVAEVDEASRREGADHLTGSQLHAALVHLIVGQIQRQTRKIHHGNSARRRRRHFAQICKFSVL